ncbi:MAG: hypothetical protein ACR2KK_12790 [Acidimicrobiales bacterium]
MAVTTAVAVAGVALAAGLSARPDGERAPRITAAAAAAATSTTVAGQPASKEVTVEPTTLAPVPSTPKPAVTVAPAPTTTTVASPDRARPAGQSYRPEAVWPETLAELDSLQAAVDQGHQPWRNDPVEVARAYLVDRGLPTAGLAAFRATGTGAGSVDYTVAGRGGRVDLQRLLKGSIWYVAGSRSATLPGIQVDRRGGALVVVVQSGVDATLTARVKGPGGQWGATQSGEAFTGGTRSFTLEPGAASGALIVQLRVEGDGKAGVAEAYVGQGTEGMQYSALDSESRLRVDGLGPVRIGMGLEEARAASGLPMVLFEGPSCVGYRTNGAPVGVNLVGAGTQRLDFISVSEPSIVTVSGIRVGATLADVRRVYGDRAKGSLQDGWGKLVVRADDASLDRFALALLFSEGKVAGMWSGLRTLVESDEICA